MVYFGPESRSLSCYYYSWMSLNCHEFEFLENFARFRRFGRQQLNEDRPVGDSDSVVTVPLNVGYFLINYVTWVESYKKIVK